MALFFTYQGMIDIDPEIGEKGADVIDHGHQSSYLCLLHFQDILAVNVKNYQVRKLIIDKLDVKKVNEVLTEVAATAIVNLCNQDVLTGEEMLIN